MAPEPEVACQSLVPWIITSIKKKSMLSRMNYQHAFHIGQMSTVFKVSVSAVAETQIWLQLRTHAYHFLS